MGSRRRALVGFCVWIAVFLATNAQAQEYVIQDGVLTDPVTNETTDLSGTLALSPFTFDADGLSDVYLIDDFAVLLGDMRLVPALPIEYMGETAVSPMYSIGSAGTSRISPSRTAKSSIK